MTTKIALVIGYVWVEPNSSAAGNRMLQLITLFLQQGYRVVFTSPAQKSDKKFDLTSIGVQEISIELNNASFDEYVRDLNPEDRKSVV